MHALRCPVLPAASALTLTLTPTAKGLWPASPLTGKQLCPPPARQHPDPREVSRREGTFSTGVQQGRPTSATAPGDRPLRTPGGPRSCKPAAGWRRAGCGQDRAPGTARRSPRDRLTRHPDGSTHAARCPRGRTASATIQHDAQGQNTYGVLSTTNVFHRMLSTECAGARPGRHTEHTQSASPPAGSGARAARAEGTSVLEERHVVGEPGQLLLVGDRRDRGRLCA